MPDHVIAIPSQLGPVLRALRLHRGMSQKTFGERLGVSRQAVSELEKAPQRAAFDRLHRACALLDVEIVLRPRETKRDGGW